MLEDKETGIARGVKVLRVASLEGTFANIRWRRSMESGVGADGTVCTLAE